MVIFEVVVIGAVVFLLFHPPDGWMLLNVIALYKDYNFCYHYIHCDYSDVIRPCTV